MVSDSKRIGLGLSIIACLAAYAACTNTNPDAPTTTSGPDGGGTNPEASVGDAGLEGGPSGPAKPFHAVTGAEADERITGVYCPSAVACVVSTTGASTAPHLYAIDATKVNSTPLFTSNDALATTAGIAGTVEFLGFSKVGNTLIARLDKAGKGFLSATADPLQAGSWSATTLGPLTGDAFALNAQYGFGVKGTSWIQLRNSFVYTAPAAPAPATTWTTVWSPGGAQQVPADLNALHAADPTLCLSEVGYSASPRPTQASYVAADGAIVLYPAHALNQQQQDDDSGVCISTDGGNRFHLAKLPGLADGINGPSALTCTSKDHCVVAGGMVFTAGSGYVYVSNNASAGATSTWTAAKIPATTDNTIPHQIFFAPDGQNGWLVGTIDTGPMLWSTTDGGANWTDQTASIASFTDRKLWSGYAFDPTRVVIGGETGVIISNL
jgi:hypothetical protein